MRGEPRLHQVRLSFIALQRFPLTGISNLTFGAGGKDKDGKNVSGWGYYEVRTLLPLTYSHR